MPNKKKDVELKPSSVASGWKVKHDGVEGDKPGSGPGSYPPVVLPEKSGPHLVVFKIPESSTAKFNKTDPMWVQKGTSSPTQSGFDPQIEGWYLSENQKELVLLDLNSEPGDLYYRVKADNYVPILDPIIKNGGGTYPPPITPNAVTTPQADYGGSGFASRDFSGAEIAAAIFVLVATFFAGFFLHKWFIK